MAEAAEPAKRGPRGPFIMPDGRPLTAALAEQQAQFARRVGGSYKPRPGRIKEPKEGWTKALPRAATAAAAAAGPGASGAQSEAEAAELYALSRVGHRKQRRWLNDKLLRDMAGALTASDMASLFKPVPFGEPRTSLWEQAAQPEHAYLWDMFRSLEIDKQTRVLQKWEAHVRELQASSAAIRNPAVEAIAAWAGVSWKARQALKRSSPSHVAAIEAPILAFLQEGEGGELVLSDLEDGFHRLIAHGLAEYHGLNSHSRAQPEAAGSKEVVLRRRPAAAAAAGAFTSAAALEAAEAEAGGDGDAAAAGAQQQQQGQQQQEQQGQQQGTLAISCADILHILEDERQPLCPAILHQAYLHPMDSSSEAGDLFHTRDLHHHHHQAAATEAGGSAAAAGGSAAAVGSAPAGAAAAELPAVLVAM